jgi:hypothetical protein
MGHALREAGSFHRRASLRDEDPCIAEGSDMETNLETLFASFTDPKDREFIEEAIRLQDEAERSGIQLRLLGALAFRLQCPKNASKFEALERRISDIDFAASSHQRDEILTFFKDQGYLVDENVLYTGGGYRYIFENPDNHNHIDIFFDRLEMSHTIPFQDRLAIEGRTISLADMLLEKMQIVEINRKDFKDAAVLLLEHEVGTEDRTINIEYISGIMRDDWGFFHTFTVNLAKLRDALPQFESFTNEERAIVEGRIAEMLERVNAAEKSTKWKLRARIGTRLRWYQQVD